MNFKKISIITLSVLIMVSFVMPIAVNAAPITASTYWEQQATKGTSTYGTTNYNPEVTQVTMNYDDIEFKYNTVSGHIYASLFYFGKTPTTDNGGYYYLIIWHTQTLSLFSTNGRVNCTNAFSYKKCVSLEEAHEILFDTSLTQITIDGTATSTYVFQPVILEANSYTGTGYNGSEGNPNLTAMGMGEYYTTYINTTTEEPEEDDTSGIIETLKKYLNPFEWIKLNNGSFILDRAGELINDNLKDNKFYTSILTIKDTLTDLYNEDYTDPQGFYDLGLTTLTLKDSVKTTYVYQGGSHTSVRDEKIKVKIDEEEFNIDFGLDNAKIINLDWYFGGELKNGYYKQGLKPTIDAFISAFLWLMFAWYLYLNLPNWLSGDLTKIEDMITSSSNDTVVYNTESNTRVVDNLTGEVIVDRTKNTNSKRKRGK